jgi:NodT family efflux transporter outer membrane factor (OMF) lipoprotein
MTDLRELAAAAASGGALKRACGLAIALGLMPMISGCILTADKLDPMLDVPQTYRAAHGAPGAATPELDWWRSFRSAELTDLMEQASAANLDIAAAVARIVQADAQARVAGAALLPTISGDVSDTRSRSSSAALGTGQGVGDRTLYNVSLTASYVLDFWGRNRALTRAAEQTAVASRFDREVVALTALVSVADTYFLVLEGQDRLRVARDNLASSERILKIIQDRFNNGTAAALDVAQQASLVAIQRASIPPLIVQIDQNKATLGLLVGRSPEHIAVRGGSLYRLAVPAITPGLPSQLLTQRPDVREAEAKLAGADANVEAARAAFLPTIQLTGQGGVQSTALHNLFTPGAVFYSLAASAMQPIFDGGTLLGQLDQQRGLREELLQDYRKAVISAFTDVEKALVAVAEFARQERLQRDAVRESRRAFDLSEERLRAGTIDLTTLLQVQQTLFQQEDTLATVRFSRMQALVSLFQALGGGWQLDKELEREARLGPRREITDR